MPSNPVPAVNAGGLVMRSEHHGKHLIAVLFRVASTGALVQISEPVRISYALAQDAMAKVEGTPYADELGFVGDVDELGALGKRIKQVAKKIAASKLVKGVKALGKVATAIIPGANIVKSGFKAAKGVVGVAKGIKRGGLKGGLRAGLTQGVRFAVGGTDDMFPELGAAKPRALPAPKKAPAKAPAKKAAPAAKQAPAKAPAKKPAPAKAPAKKAAPAAKKAPAKKPAPAKAPPKKAAPAAAAKKAPAKKPAPAKAPAKKAPAKKAPAKGKAPAAAATRPAAVAPLAPATAAKLEQITSSIEEAAPELAEEIQALPDTPPEERDFRAARVKEALKVIAAKPPEERPAAAAAIQERIDSYKVTAPDGTITWVPRAVAEG